MSEVKSSKSGKKSSKSGGSSKKKTSKNHSKSDSEPDIEKGVIELADKANNLENQHDFAENDDEHHKIKFKRARKLHKAASMHYMKHMHDLSGGRFHQWSKAQLAELLISQGVELRNEDKLDASSLRELCDAIYFELPMPEKPKLPSMFDIVYHNVMARKIQNAWIIYQMQKRFAAEEKASEDYIRSLEKFNRQNDAEMGQAEMMYMNTDHQYMVGDSIMTEDEEMKLALSRSLDEHEESKLSEIKQKAEEEKKKPKNILDIPWVPPDIEKAKVHADYVQPRKGGKGGKKFDFYKTTTGRHCCLGGMGEQFDLWEEGQISEFGIYGSGVTNYFKFIKWCFWLFAILAIISLPSLVMNIYGPNSSNNGLDQIAKTTVGNLATSVANATVHLHVPGCNSYSSFKVNCYLGRTSLAKFYSGLDIVVSGVIIIAYIWLRVFEKVEESELDKNTINASMFTVMVGNLPPDTTEKEIIDHFHRVLGKDVKIGAVFIAYDNIEEIRECMKRGDIIRAKVRLVHDHRYQCTRLRDRKGEKAENEIPTLRDKFLEKMKKLNKELKEKEELLEKYSKIPQNVLYSFVTFNKVAGRAAALRLYNDRSFLSWLFDSNRLKLRGRLITLTKASEPSTIIWENLAYGFWERMRRRGLVTFLAFLLVVISFIIILCSEYLQNSTGGNNNTTLCPASFNSMTNEQQRAYVEANSEYLYCYCNQFTTVEQGSDSLCRHYLIKTIQSQVLVYFASFIVLIINNLMEYFMRMSSDFEKHHTEDNKGKSVFLRLFFLKYLNTSVIFFVNNNGYLMNTIFGLNINGSTEFSPGWFNTVGVTLVLVQIGDCFLGHGDKYMKWILYNRKVAAVKNNPSKALTQEELNKIQVGPEFEFAFNYAQLVSTFFVCLTFSTGIPILYAIGAANFFVFYMLDKYFFINLYRIPPHFNSLIGKRATSLLPYALILHLAISIWMLSNPELFSSSSESGTVANQTTYFGSTVRSKITSHATFPLFIILCVTLVIILLSYLSKKFSTVTDRFLTSIFGVCYRRLARFSNSASAQSVVTYTRAVQRNLIKGLATYNILQNPIYKEAFAITWKFAVANKNVRDVRNLKNKAHVEDEEFDAAKVEKMQRNIRSVDSRGASMKLKNRSFFGSFYTPSLALSNDVNDPPPRPNSKGSSRPSSTQSRSPPPSNIPFSGGPTSNSRPPSIDGRLSNPSHEPSAPYPMDNYYQNQGSYDSHDSRNSNRPRSHRSGNPRPASQSPNMSPYPNQRPHNSTGNRPPRSQRKGESAPPPPPPGRYHY